MVQGETPWLESRADLLHVTQDPSYLPMCMYLSSQVTLNSLIVLYVVNSYTCDMVVLLVPCTTSSSGCTWALDNKGC